VKNKDWAKATLRKIDLAISYIKSEHLILAQAELACARSYMEAILKK